MKRILPLPAFILLLALIISMSGCKKNDTPTQTVSYNVANYQGCDGYYGTDTFAFTITAFDVQQAFINTGVTYDLSKVNTAKLTGITATVLYGSNFDPVSTIAIYLKVSGAAGVGQRIAHAENISTGKSTIALALDGTELKGYLGANADVTIVVQNKTAGNGDCYSFTQGVIQATVVK